MKKYFLLITLLFFFLIIPQAQAAITAGTGTASSWINSTPQDISVNVASGSNIALVVSIGSDAAVSSVAYNGAILTKLWDQVDGVGVTHSSAWILVNPSTGTNTLHVVWSSAPDTARVWAQPWYGVAQGGSQGTTWRAPLTANDGGSGSGTASVSVSNAQSGDTVIDVVSDYTKTLTVNPSQNLQYQDNGPAGTYLYWGASSKSATGATTMSWTMASTWWAMGAVALIPANTALVSPTISSFSPSPSSITSGQSSTLSWSVSGSPTPTLTLNGSPISGSSTTVSPTQTTTYTLVATNSQGTTQAQTTVTVAPATAPTISSFSASPTSINQGNSSTLSWSVSGTPTPTLSISGIGTVTGNSTSVSPANTTTYTLTATNSAGSINANTTVTVSVPPPDTTPPSTPTNLSATAVSSSQINLSWSASTDNTAVTGYKIYRNGSQITTTSNTNYSDTGLTANTQYSYTVSAYDAAGNNSSQSSSVSATTQTSAPPPASGCSGSGLSWSCAAGASTAQVQSVINNATDGATVTFAPGSYSWSTISLNNIDGVTIICSTAGACNVSFSGGVFSRDYIPTAITKLMRISGFNFSGSAGTAAIWLYGSSNINQLRIDHNSFSIGASQIAVLLGETSSPGKVYGVMDHNTCSANNNFMCLKNISGGSTSADWVTGQQGSGNAFFFESNTCNFVNNSDLGTGCVDVWRANSTVLRFNTLTNARFVNHSYCHGGPYNSEIYKNVINDVNPVSSQYRNIHLQGSGEEIVWGNTVEINANGDTIVVQHFRGDSSTATSEGDCNSLANGSVNGSGVDAAHAKDGNRPGQYGYPAWHQPGRDVDGTLKPVYSFMNMNAAGTKVNMVLNSSNSMGEMNENRDYYNAVSASAQTSPTSPFNGTAGVGFGTLANRPTTCTPTSDPLDAGHGGVGYWATDQGEWDSTHAGPDGELFTCTAPNTWSLAYIPYQYPHPLVSGSSQPTTYTLTSSASTGGAITPSGVTTINSGSSQTFTITPNTGYTITSVTVDGSSVGAVSSYTFNNVTTNHTISATFTPTPPAGGSTKFTPGQRVQTTSNLNVRATPSASGTLLGTQPSGALGTIVSGGQSADGYYWWNVNYDPPAGGLDGWSVEDYLTSYSAPIPGDLNSDGLVNSIDLSLLTSHWLQSYPAYDLNSDGIINSLDFAIMSSHWSP